mgnify:CR=1 FL=1
MHCRNDDVASAREITITSAAPAPSHRRRRPCRPGAVVIVAKRRAPHRAFRKGRASAAVRLDVSTKTMGGVGQVRRSTAGANAAIAYGGVWRLCNPTIFLVASVPILFRAVMTTSALPTGRVSSAELRSRVGASHRACVSCGAVQLRTTGQVVLYELPNFGGQSVVIDRVAIPGSLQRHGFNGSRASSIGDPERNLDFLYRL